MTDEELAALHARLEAVKARSAQTQARYKTITARLDDTPADPAMTDEDRAEYLWHMTHATHSGEHDALYMGKSLLDTMPVGRGKTAMTDEEIVAQIGDNVSGSITTHSADEVKRITTILHEKGYRWKLAYTVDGQTCVVIFFIDPR